MAPVRSRETPREGSGASLKINPATIEAESPAVTGGLARASALNRDSSEHPWEERDESSEQKGIEHHVY